MLQTKDLSISYAGLKVVRGVSVVAREGQITAIIGPNGAGKSSIVNAIIGLLPRASVQGEILFDGKPIAGARVYERIEMGMALLPEERRLFPLLTVDENLDLGAYCGRAKPARVQTRERVFKLFPRLLERRRQMAGSLSGGEQQMLALGRALMSQPRLLVLDEPSVGLAPIIVQGLFSVIKELNATGTTVLIVEQNTYQTLKIAHHAYVLEAGTIVHEGTGEALLRDPNVRQSYLGLEA